MDSMIYDLGFFLARKHFTIKYLIFRINVLKILFVKFCICNNRCYLIKKMYSHMNVKIDILQHCEFYGIKKKMRNCTRYLLLKLLVKQK